YLPLEQGLRPSLIVTPSDSYSLREYLPLEQGLRQIFAVTPAKKEKGSESIFH
ncbi:hypothetical protein HMPREF9148_02444, partial [Prevotella sp. F0091]